MFYKSGNARQKNFYLRLLCYSTLLLIFAMPIGISLEQHFLYFPTKAHDASPNTIGLAYEDLFFTSGDGTKLNGWLIPGQNNAPVILFCMGNAGNISHRLDTLQLLHDIGVNVFIFNYRGYGKSEGKASEKGLYEDVSAAYKLLLERGWKKQEVIVFGRSLGAAVGLELTIRSSPVGLIMESAFTSVPAMGRYHYFLLNSLLGWLIDAEYNNLAKIRHIKSPLLLIHGDRDNICPPHMTEELFNEAPTDKQLYWVHGAGHNDGFIVGGEKYKSVLTQTIKSWTGFVSP